MSEGSSPGWRNCFARTGDRRAPRRSPIGHAAMTPVATAPCPLCGARLAEPFLAPRHPSLVRCACGLVTWASRPEPEELDRLYNEQVYSGVPYYLRAVHADRRTFRKLFPRIEALTEPRHALDVGCATGAFLD